MTIEAFSPFEFLPLLLGDRIDDRFGDMQCLHNICVENAYSPCSKSAHGQFFVSRNAQFAYYEDIKWGMKGFCHLSSDRYSTARKRQEKNVSTIGIRRQLCRKHSTCFKSIMIHCFHLAPHYKLFHSPL